MSASPAVELLDVGMPRLSDSMEEATVLQWLKQPGEQVAKGEPLVEVETDKATIVYEAETDGRARGDRRRGGRDGRARRRDRAHPGRAVARVRRRGSGAGR